MTTTLDEALTILRANQTMLRERGVLHAAVFGSVARGEARADSDVDILVDLEPGKPSGIFEYVRLQRDIAGLLGGKVDVVERAALKRGVREEAIKDAIHVF
jgi:predicted nucleotidyltransferase